MERQMEHHMRLPPPVAAGATIHTGSSSPSPRPLAPHQRPPPPHAPRPPPLLSPPFGPGPYGASAASAASAAHRYQPPLPSARSPQSLATIPRCSPPTYSSPHQLDHAHDPAALSFPPAPSTELPPLRLDAQGPSVDSLPPLASLTGGPSPQQTDLWPSGNPLTAYYTAHEAQAAASPAQMDVDSRGSRRRGPLSPAAVDDSVDDRVSSLNQDEKMAAEELLNLHTKEVISWPSNRSSNEPSPGNHSGRPGPSEAEPLLRLVMTSGSSLAVPIGGVVSAYNWSKNQARWLKAPVECVEGMVGSVSQSCGVDHKVRRYFSGNGRQYSSSGDIESGAISHKRRKVNSDGQTSAPRDSFDAAPPTSADAPEPDLNASKNPDRRLSMSTVDSLPPYDDARSPAYTEDALAMSDEKSDHNTSRPSSTPPTAWGLRLIESTSALGVAMSDESLRCLKYCLSTVRWANGKLASLIRTLQDTLEQYDSHGQIYLAGDHTVNQDPTVTSSAPTRTELRARISALCSDVLETIQDVTRTVSRYAGGALPENARTLIRRHLISLPRRLWLVTRQSRGGGGGSPAPSSQAATEASFNEVKEHGERERAVKVLALAKEGLDMVQQVSDVLAGTIQNAEMWLDRLGKNKGNAQAEDGRSQQEKQQTQTAPFAGVDVRDGDVKMG